MRKRNRLFIYLAIIALLILAAVAYLRLTGFSVCRLDKQANKPPAYVPSYEFQKAITYVAWTEEGYYNPNSVKSIERLASIGVNWAAVITTWYQDRCESTEIYALDEKTPSEQGLRFAIRKMHELGIKVMLKPHLELIKCDGKWRGDIGGEDDSGWQAWFASYTDFILRHAKIAQEENVELFCVGTELSKASISRPEMWRELIGKVRSVYQGPLTYAANWFEEFNQITFWDALDYAGLEPYFPLVGSLRPTVEELKQAWSDWVEIIEFWQRDIDKPVIFTEVGYKSLLGAMDEPWQHSPLGEVDLELQANCYQALLETFWDKPWFYGVYWWYWGAHPKMGGGFHRGFTPQNKPAEEVLKEWYTQKAIPAKQY